MNEILSWVEMGNLDAVEAHGASAVIFGHGGEDGAREFTAFLDGAQGLGDLGVVEFALYHCRIHGIDDGRLQVDILEALQGLTLGQYRCNAALAPGLLRTLGLENVQYLPTFPGGLPRDPFPCVRGHPHPVVARQSLTDVVSNRRTVAVQFHTGTQAIGIHEIVRVAKTGRVDDLDGGGVLPAPIR